MHEQTAATRRAELSAKLNDLLTVCAVNCPDSPAMASAELLFHSLGGATADADPFKHAQKLNLLESCIAQVRAGATELDLNPPRRQPTLDGIRADLERTLPRGPNRG